MITTTIVTSKDGVGFSVTFYSRTTYAARMAEVAEARFAATRLAVELESFGDYRRVDPLTGYVAAPAPTEPWDQTARRLAARGGLKLTLIHGGRWPVREDEQP